MFQISRQQREVIFLQAVLQLYKHRLLLQHCYDSQKPQKLWTLHWYTVTVLSECDNSEKVTVIFNCLSLWSCSYKKKTKYET